ncbi:uncharacterized protein LOC108625345 isoform X2 [Ceratina calcarata]|uniref:Copper transport protein n=1 Tax=Ceratina calcarata TaxID=156304 RepID=A0AAJ7J019_9HYME|nr:uncharacterized protein LOC108625345 isoform X2 [Ceratina calcarata]
MRKNKVVTETLKTMRMFMKHETNPRCFIRNWVKLGTMARCSITYCDPYQFNHHNFVVPRNNRTQTCYSLFALAILYESMKILQIKLKQNTVPQSTSVSEGSCLLSKILTRSIGPNASIEGIRWPAWCFQVFHWSIHTFLSYLLMLAVMTYNVYVNVAIVLGGCLGYWIFGPRLIELNMKQFHDKQRLLDCDKECAEHIMNEERRGSTISIVAEQLVTETTVEVHVPGTI